ncbi:MAG: acyl CoA--acetate/3-ketoacid CoA transferase subunit beta [Firmicutes bacterium]|nr:acyl CoA--acetate/3-ketoacid CoA transferase subunit beta [Bacillota bacterium]
MNQKYANPADYKPAEAMIIYSARALKGFNGKTGLIGIGSPLVSAQIAKRLYCPDMLMIVETGQADANPQEVPISIMDSRLTYGSSWQMGDPEGLFPLMRGEIDFGFIGGAQIDKYGNVNSTFIGGDYNKPMKRLAGTAGAVDIGGFAKTTIITMAHQKRRILDQVDYLTTPGWVVRRWPEGDWVRREEIGLVGGPSVFISSLGIMRFDDETKLMYVDQCFPGVTPEMIKENTSFDIDISRAKEAEPLLIEELRVLREEVDPLNIYRTR